MLAPAYTGAMPAHPIDWSQLWYPGPARRFSAAEMARAGAQAPSATLKAVALANTAVLAFVTLQLAPSRFTAVLTGLIAAMAALSWMGARWLWWQPWRGPLWRATAAVTIAMVLLALGVRWRTEDIELRRWLAGALVVGSLLASLSLWFLAVWRSHQIEARLRELDERERAAEMARQLLAAQIQPHFLFNSLAALSHWVQTKDDRAAPLLEALTGYLRATLPLFQRQLLSLGEEVDAVRRYLQVMQLRLGGRLQVQIDVPQALHGVPLPPGVLLTLVENAIEHGIEPQLRGGTVRVAARQLDACVQVEVLDDGPGPLPDVAEGLGLSNARARLGQAFGALASLQLQRHEPAGSCVRLRLPLAQASSP